MIREVKILLGGEVKETIDPHNEKTTKRAYQLQNIKNQQRQVRSSQNKFASSIMPTADIKSVVDLFAVVKHFDKIFSPKPIKGCPKQKSRCDKTTAFLTLKLKYTFGGVDDVKDELFISLRETFFEVFL